MSQDVAAPALRRQRQSGLVDLLNVLILGRLSFHPLTGYELSKELQREYGLHLSFGTLYPHLHSLEAFHLIQHMDITNTRRRSMKQYKLRAEGEQQLATDLHILAKIVANLRPVMETHQAGRPLIKQQ